MTEQISSQRSRRACDVRRGGRAICRLLFSMKPLLLLALLFTVLHPVIGADKKTRFVSPDEKYAVTLTPAEPPEEPGMTAVNLIEVKAGAVVKALDPVGHPWIDDTKVVWAPDSQRLALMTGSRRGGWTTLYAKAGRPSRRCRCRSSSGRR